MPYRPARSKLRMLTARADAMKTMIEDAEADRAYGERENVRMAYLQSPAGREMDGRIEALARGLLSAIYDAKQPELQTHDPCPRCGDRASPHICGPGPKRSQEEISADFEAVLKEAQRQAEAWAASGAPGAPAWYVHGDRKYWQE